MEIKSFMEAKKPPCKNCYEYKMDCFPETDNPIYCFKFGTTITELQGKPKEG